MRVIVISFLCIALAASVSIRAAERCSDTVCTMSNGCRCASLNSPLAAGDTPQLISLTFDEAVLDNVFQDVWRYLLFNRTNPDGNLISGTFFVPHEYTDYSRVQDLWLQGYEIGVSSITNSLAEYWSNAPLETLVQEFQGQRILMSNFANIPMEDIVGARTPQLQIEGDVTINAYIQSGLAYDNSWTTRSSSRLFPYTLDYLSDQECRTGTTCPTESHAGFWIAPIINIQTNETIGGIIECNYLTTCNYRGSAEDILAWLLAQVERERSDTRSPLTLMVPSAWFRFTNNSMEAFLKFLDTLAGYDDVYLVSVQQAIDWVKNPVPLSQFQTVVPNRTRNCLAIECLLYNTNGDLRYMKSCVPCPDVYPWLGNPLGENNPTDPLSITPHTEPTTTEPTTTSAS